MAQIHELMFYELMWQIEARGRPLPLPWWVQQYFRHWTDNYDEGLFSSKEAAFASNAHYRYWNMVGVKDHHQESLIGQSGEIEPVYDQYTLSFFLFGPSTRKLHFPQFAGLNGSESSLNQRWQDGYLPVLITTYQSPLGIEIEEKAIATTVGVDQKSVVLVRFNARLTTATSAEAWLCVSISPMGPTGFQRYYRAGNINDRRLTFLRFLQAEQRVEANFSWGPVFDINPVHFGLYGNKSCTKPDFYLENNPYKDLVSNGALNGQDTATDYVAGVCIGVFTWPMSLSQANPTFSLDMRLPVDD